MKKVGFIIFIVALVIGVAFSNAFSFGQNSGRFFNFSVSFGRGVKGSGRVVTEKRELRGFNKIEAGGNFEIEAVAQNDFGVEVEADDNLMELVEVTVDGDTLNIRTKKRVSPTAPIKIRVAAPTIDAVDISGASRIGLANAKSERLDVELSGASRMTVSGEVNFLKAELSGASRIEAAELKAVNVDFDASGASRGNVFASGVINADLSGASNLEYAGDAKIGERSTSGASSIRAAK